MKKLLTFLTLLTLFFTTAWATEGDVHDMGITQSTNLNNNASIPSVNIAAQSYPVKAVTINWRYNKTIANPVTIEVIVGGTSWGTKTITGNTTADAVFEGTSTTGAVEINFTNNTGSGTGHGTFYVNSVKLTEGPGGTPATPHSINVTGGTADPASASQGQTVTLTPSIPTGQMVDWDNTTVSPSSVIINHSDYTFTMPDEEVTIVFAFMDDPYADAVFYEPFTGSSGYTVSGSDNFNNGAGSGTPAFVNSFGDWDLTNGSGAGDAIKVGTGKVKGSAITPTITGLTAGATYTLTFLAAPWNTETATMNVTASNGSIDDLSTTAMTTQQWNSYTATFTPSSTSATLTFSSSQNRFFLDEVALILDATQVSVERPTISGETPFLTSSEVTITCGTTGSTIYYTTDGTDPSDASDEYTAPFTLTSSATVKAIAYVGAEASPIATKSFEKNGVANISEMLAYNGSGEFTFTGDVVVTYFNSTGSGYLWVKDATGSSLLYNSNLSTANPAPAQNDVIKGGWKGQKTNYHNLIEVTGVTTATIEGTQTVTPAELTLNDITVDNQATYGWLRGVKVTEIDERTFKISNGTQTVNGYNTYNNDSNIGMPTEASDSKTYDIRGIVNVYNNAQFTPVQFVEQVPEEPTYYLYGSFNNWSHSENLRQFTDNGDGTYTLNNTNLPDNVRFKILKKQGTTVLAEIGADNNGSDYGINGGWHTNIPMDGANAYTIQKGGATSFVINGTTMTFDVSREDKMSLRTSADEWVEHAMTQTENGWTITKEMTKGEQFEFADAWNYFGNDWWIQNSHLGNGISLNNNGLHFQIDIDGTAEYKFVVNNDKNQVVITRAFAVNCSVVTNIEGKIGGTITADKQTAYPGETVTLTINTNAGYELTSVTLNGTTTIDPVEGVYSFTMPNAEANVVANFTVNYYDLVLQNDETLGEVSGLPQNMKAYTGQEVSFSVTALGENEIDKVTYEYNGGNPQTLTATEGTYKFNMPPFEVTIKVTYIEPLQPCTIRFEESWPETAGLGGNDDVWSTSGNSPAAVSQNLGWIYKDGDTEFQGYGADNCIRIGKRNGAGSATTPEIIVTNGTIYKMTFRAGGWTSDNTTINLSAEGAELFSDANCTTSIETETITSESWTEFEVYVKATSSLMRITWAAPPTRSRFFLDDVVIDFFETPLPTEATLAQIITLGENADGKLYKISNEDGLLGVYSQGQSVWFKDEYPEQAVDYQDPLENTNYKYYTVVEDALEINKSEKDFDQSNWIEVVFQDNASYNNKYVKNLTGTYSWQNGNPKLTLTVDVDETNDVTDVQVGALAYDLNPYMAANFAGTQDGTIQGETHTYFFSKPKAQEYAQILWAVWDGSKFNMPTTNNAYGFTGSFTVSDELNGGVSLDGLQQGETYNFKAVIRKTASKAGSYEVYPTDLNPGVVTGVGMINVNGNVKSVKYVNVAGIVSDVPFQGVNIVVTEYTDGSRTTTKMLKK